MKKQSLSKTIDVSFSIKEVAQFFASLDSYEQAIFFNEVYLFVKDEYEGSFCYQMNAVSKEHLSDGARSIMSTIGEYAYEENRKNKDQKSQKDN